MNRRISPMRTCVLFWSVLTVEPTLTFPHFCGAAMLEKTVLRKTPQGTLTERAKLGVVFAVPIKDALDDRRPSHETSTGRTSPSPRRLHDTD